MSFRRNWKFVRDYLKVSRGSTLLSLELVVGRQEFIYISITLCETVKHTEKR